MSAARLDSDLVQVHLARWLDDDTTAVGRSASLTTMTRIGVYEVLKTLTATWVVIEPDVESAFASLAFIALSSDGLLMIEPALSVLPDAKVHFMGEVPDNPDYMDVLLPTLDARSGPLRLVLMAPTLHSSARILQILETVNNVREATYYVFAFLVSHQVVSAVEQRSDVHLTYIDVEA